MWSLWPFEHGVEEIEHKDELYQSAHNGEDGNHHVQIRESTEEFKVLIITAGNAGQAHVMHREKHPVGRNQGYPEVQIAQFFVHHAAKHFGEPVVNARKGAEHRGYAHNNVEVGYHKIGVVQIHVQGAVGQNDAR